MIDALHWFVYHFGDYEALSRSGLSGIDAPVMDGLIAMIVQFVYCWRVWVLSEWRAFPVFIALVCQRLNRKSTTFYSFVPQISLVTNISAMTVGISVSLKFGIPAGTYKRS